MSDWQHEIPDCFGEESLVFAETPSELAVALRMRRELREAGLSGELIESAIEHWLHAQTSNTGQLFEQMARVRAFFGGQS